ncbi:MAG: DUF2341 domain-containing protein [Flavobacteriales bacterium]|nr:DUF2341 domain-containing protein [Flavobacteriales bacterium]
MQKLSFTRLKVVLLAVVGVILFSSNKVLSQPCYSGYQYRVPIIIDNSKNSSLSDFQLMITINSYSLITNGKMQSLGQDLRFLNSKGTYLPFWIEDNTINTSTTNVWIRVDTLHNYTNDTIYMYYGNSTASAASNSQTTFQLMDDFNGSSLSGSWSSCGSGSASVTGGKLNLSSTGGSIAIKSSTGFTGSLLVELLGVNYASGNLIAGQINTSDYGYGILHNGSTVQMNTLAPNSGCYAWSGFGSTNSTSIGSKLSFVWSGSTQIANWSTSGMTTTNSTNSSTTYQRGFVSLSGSAGSVQIDQIRIRKYAVNTPSYSISNEQNMNYTISATYSTPLCEGGNLFLQVNSITGAKYSWTGPNGFTSKLQNPQITGVKQTDGGRYDLTVEIPNGCASKSSSVNVNVSAKAVGGTISGTQTVCPNSNAGQLSLSGHTGNVQRWDSAHSSTGPWYPIKNTGLNQAYLNLSATTYYRAIVANGNCSVDSSSIATITVTPPSDGGYIDGAATVCASANSGIVTVKSYVGNILRWQSSLNGNLWTDIVNKGANHSYNNLAQSTHFRAVVQNGNCDVAFSTPALITVDQPTLGGYVDGSASVCSGSNSGWLVLKNYRGSVLSWEYSLTGSTIWYAVSNTTDSLKYQNITLSTQYRAVLKNNTCNVEVSTPATLAIVGQSASGTLSGGKEVCASGNSGVMNLANYTGKIVKWQYNTPNATWTDISHTADVYYFSSLSDTTNYRVIVANGSCQADTSNVQTILVNPVSNGGYIDGDDLICVSSGKASIELKSWVGDIEDWQTSTSGYAPWISTNKTSSTITLDTIKANCYVRAIVKSGVCQSQNSTIYKITVSSLSDAGKISNDINLCKGSNYGVIKISNYSGDVVKWQTSTSTTGGWSDVFRNTDRYDVQNIDTSEYVRAIVQNGVCPSDTSDVAAIIVHEYSDGGNIFGDTIFCSSTNNGIVTLANITGVVNHWEYSTNLGGKWAQINSTSDSLTFNNVAGTTQYRAVIKNGACQSVYSPIATITIQSASNAGVLTADQSEVCEGSNFGNIILDKYLGQIKGWQIYKTGTGWIDDNYTTAQRSYTNLNETTRYRVVVQNSICAVDTSNEVEIKVSLNTLSGKISGVAEVCKDGGITTLKINGQTGQVLDWETTENLYYNWTSLGSDTLNLPVSNNATSAYYRAIIKSGVCNLVHTEPFQVTSFEKSDAGTLMGGRELCNGQNEGYLELTNYTGKIVDWQIDTSSTWKPLGFTGELYWYENLGKNTHYRAIVKNGVCPADTGNLVQMTINPLPKLDFVTKNLCHNQVASFVDMSTISSGKIAKRNWQVSDGFIGRDSAFSKLFTTPGIYTVFLTATTDKGCVETLEKSIVVGETPVAFFSLENGVSLNAACLGVSTKFVDNTNYSSKSELDYFWDFGNGKTSTAQTPSNYYDTAGHYPVTLITTTRQGCSDTFTYNLEILKQNPPQVKNSSVQASVGVGMQLQASGSEKYKWYPAQFLDDPTSAKPVATVTQNTLFVVEGTDYYGCKSIDSVWVYVTEDFLVFPNNVITPDRNNQNDYWIVNNIENYPENKVSVFDRWGREVFSTKHYQNDWDGTNKKGQYLMDGTYYYVIEFDNSDKVYKGAITVVNNQ